MMPRRFTLPLVVVMLVPRAFAADAPPTDWRVVARQCELTDPQIACIERDEFVLVDEGIRQIYQTYLALHPTRSGVHLGTLITSDLLLAVTNACLDETLLLTEAKQASAMRSWVAGLWRELPTHRIHAEPNETALLAAGVAHARFVLATLLTVLGQPPAELSPELRAKVAAEVARIESASEHVAPPWSDAVIDYRTMRPPPTYRYSPVLAGVFRARKWLAQLAFDPVRDRDLTAWLILADLDGRRGPYVTNGITGPGHGLFALGGSRPETGFRSTSSPDAGTSLGQLIAGLRGTDGRPSLLHAHEEPPLPVPFVRTRLARLAPSESLFADPGLAAGAWLQSPVVAPRVSASAITRLREITDDEQSKFAPAGSYLYALSSLGLPPDPAAPAVFCSEAWRLKSLQTALAGWAQLDIDRPLHTRVTCCSGTSSHDQGPMLIEPNPTFFSRLASSLAQLADEERGAGDFAMRVSMAVEARWWAAYLGRLETNAPSREMLGEVAALVTWNDGAGVNVEEPTHDPTEEEDVDDWMDRDLLKSISTERALAYAPVISTLLERADQWERGEMPSGRAPSFGKFVWRRADALRRLVDYSRRLEALCHKQLRGLPFDDDESYFLLTLPSDIAWLNFDYIGSGRVEDNGAMVQALPSLAGQASTWHVGTGRPVAIYVLYPINGVPTLLRGAVMTYREFERDHTVTNDEWRAELDRDPAVGRPAWLAPLFGETAPASSR